MFVKFDENGKAVSFSDVAKQEDIRPDTEGFEQVVGFEKEDVWFLIKKDGTVQVDTESKEAYREKLEQKKLYEENKCKLEKLTEDIVQSLAGENVPDIEARKSEFIRIHNQVRVYEGKEAREVLPIKTGEN